MYTDGSFEHNLDHMDYENVTGIGIYITFNDFNYKLFQPIGDESIISSEQCALAILPNLLNKLQINNYIRMLIFTDDLPCFYSIHGSNEIPVYPKLFHIIQQYII